MTPRQPLLISAPCRTASKQRPLSSSNFAAASPADTTARRAEWPPYSSQKLVQAQERSQGQAEHQRDKEETEEEKEKLYADWMREGRSQRASMPSPYVAWADQLLRRKIGCLPCRAAKRRCDSRKVGDICARCRSHALICEYKKHNRGRKKKVTPPSPPAATSEPFASTSALSPSLTIRPATLGAAGQAVRHPLPRASTTSPGPDALSPRSSTSAIQFSHVVPVEGDSSPYLPANRQVPMLAAAPQQGGAAPDPIGAGILSELDAQELFKIYFEHLNTVVPILDPALHTVQYCRSSSALLFSAVLTVSAKAARPDRYDECLRRSNKLVGEVVELGTSSIEIVQAFCLLSHWQEAEDSKSWSRVGLAVRMAQQLRLNVRAPRPLPTDETQARKLLNRERVWLYLIIADYHLAIHYSLPRMLTDECVDDPADWVTEHPHLACPGEAILAPWITFSRMCRLYADLLAAMKGDSSDLRSLAWLENDWKRWRARWVVSPATPLLPQQISTLRLCDAYFRFHLAEYRLLHLARHSKEPLELDGPSKVAFTFGECVDAALAVAVCFLHDFADQNLLPYCFNLAWVALAVTSVWLIKNIELMQPLDRTQVIQTLSKVQTATSNASTSPVDMSAHIERLLSHQLSGVAPSLPDLNTPQPPVIPLPPAPQSWPFLATAQQAIQDGLYNPPPATNDVLFPVADDEFWRLLFPVTTEATQAGLVAPY
ncbi:hypothetical protein JCM8547_004073 [Rhodosporidiobolus lusitaniae]